MLTLHIIPIRIKCFLLISGLLLFVCVNTDAQLTTGLIASYPFDGNANDISGNAYNGAINGASPATDRFNNAGKALYFNGSAYITGNATGYPAGNSPRTISLWYKATSLGSLNTCGIQLMGYGGGSPGSSCIMVFENCINGGYNTTAKLEVQGHYLAFANYAPYPLPANNTWHHLVLSFDGSVFRFYFDGMLAAVSTPQTPNTETAGKIFCFGKVSAENGLTPFVNTSYTGFTGSLDDIRIWNRALSQTEVNQLDPCNFTVTINSNTSTALCPGQQAILSTNAYGVGNSFQWFKNSAAITGATAPTYTTGEGAAYYCRVSNSCGVTVLSNTLTIVANPSPNVSIAPTGPTTICQGSSTSLAVTAPSASYSYQWKKNGLNYGSNLPTTGVSAAGTYTCTITNSCGTANSNAVPVAVNNPVLGYPVVSGPADGLCNMNNVFFSTPAVSGATGYEWSVSYNASVVGGQGSTGAYINFGTNTQSMLVCARAYNNCFSHQICLAVRPYPKTPSSIGGPATICSFTSFNAYVIPLTYPITYTWTTSNPAIKITGGQGTSSVTVYWGTSLPGYVYLNVSNACGNSTISRYYTGKCTSFATGTRSGTVADEPKAETLQIIQEASSIKLILPAGFEKSSIQLLNTSGQQPLPPVLASGNTIALNCGQLPAGVYFIHLTSADGQVLNKRFYWLK